MKLLCNAKIYTLDSEEKSTGDGILIDRDRIVALGDSRQLRQEFAGITETLDLAGAPVIPGLVDAHFHLEGYALTRQEVDCETPTLAECLRRVAERAQTTPPGEWMLGHGWNQNAWFAPGERSFPNADELEAAAPQHPVYLSAKSYHAAWVNHAALRLAGVTANTPDPINGQIGRDAHGNPDGILFESAMQLGSQAIPAPNERQSAEAIRVAQPGLWRLGLTGLHDFDGSRCFAALQGLHQRRELGLRVLKGIPLGDLEHAVALGLRPGFGDDWLRIGQVKLFADGALGPRTAAMLQPYEGEPENRGILMLDAEQIVEHGRLALKNGFSLAIHAIGDRANHEVLNAFAQLRALGPTALPYRIEHVQVLHPADAARLAQLGVVASMQPIHATSDMLMADRYWGQRAELSYAWKTQLDHGAVLAFGSDAPVESPNPWWGIHAAVTRQSADGSPGMDGWYPAQRLTRLQALRGFTRGPALAAGLPNRLGRLAPGFLADLLALDADPFTCAVEQLKDIRPLRTMVGGEWMV